MFPKAHPPGINPPHDALKRIEFAYHLGHKIRFGHSTRFRGVFNRQGFGHVGRDARLTGQPAAQALKATALVAH